MGGTGQSALLSLFQTDTDIIGAVNEDISTALYTTIGAMNFGWATWAIAALATFLISTWFITSSDSGTLVITTMLSMGNDNPPQKFRIMWGLGEGLVAAVLLVAGGLGALQTASIAAAFPVSIILLLITWGVIKSLREDSSAVAAIPPPMKEAAQAA